jgi:hypothetical protein
MILDPGTLGTSSGFGAAVRSSTGSATRFSSLISFFSSKLIRALILARMLVPPLLLYLLIISLKNTAMFAVCKEVLNASQKRIYCKQVRRIVFCVLAIQFIRAGPQIKASRIVSAGLLLGACCIYLDVGCSLRTHPHIHAGNVSRVLFLRKEDLNLDSLFSILIPMRARYEDVCVRYTVATIFSLNLFHIRGVQGKKVDQCREHLGVTGANVILIVLPDSPKLLTQRKARVGESPLGEIVPEGVVPKSLLPIHSFTSNFVKGNC